MAATLEDAIHEAGSPVKALWNSPTPTAVAARVPAEYTNWRDEQLAWRRGVVLFHQSHHMVNLFIKGKDALRLIADLGVNSFDAFPVDKAKQFVAVTHDGYVVGDNILFHLAEDEYQMVGLPPSISWVQYHAATGGYDVDVERDDDSTFRVGDPKVYRYQVQGPGALDVVRKATGVEPPNLKFFEMSHLKIGGQDVRCLRHGMAGEPGFELWGPWQANQYVRDALIEAGQEFGLTLVGSAAYHTTALESGWFSRPLPAIYTGDRLAGYRRWLGAESYEATAPLGGSLASDDITDYYLTPFELGYGRIIAFDHDFVGRDALKRMIAEGLDQKRKKVTLVWNGADCEKAAGSLFRAAVGAKYFRMPLIRYSDFQYDRVSVHGADIGFSGFVGYSANERAILSIGVVDQQFAEPGTEVTVLWGEQPNSKKSQVEAHEQVMLRATVEPAPLSAKARSAYRQD